MNIEVTTTHLIMTSPEQFRPRYSEDDRVSLNKVNIPNPNLNHFFFTNVGMQFRWYSRLSWSYPDWCSYVNRKNVHTWVGYLEGSPFGYVELEERGARTQIMFFGILKQFFGLGLGAHLLSCAIREAWALEKTESVHVHTCNLDHEAALRNYQARGFLIDQVVTELEEVPDEGDRIWDCSIYYESLRNGC